MSQIPEELNIKLVARAVTGESRYVPAVSAVAYVKSTSLWGLYKVFRNAIVVYGAGPAPEGVKYTCKIRAIGESIKILRVKIVVTRLQQVG